MAELTGQLDLLIADLDRLIEMTEEEIRLIKDARHAEIESRQHAKERLLQQFAHHKERFNDSLVALTQQHPGAPLEEILAPEIVERLDIFKMKLQRLHSRNRDYGSLVSTVGGFFSSLVAAILPMQQEGYATQTPKPAAFLEVSV